MNDLENAVPAQLNPFQYPRLTMPIRDKGNTDSIVTGGGLLSITLSTSQPLEDEPTTFLMHPQSLNMSVPAYQNGHFNKVVMDSQFSPISLHFPPALENLTPAAWGMNIASWAALNQPTLHLRAETSPARRSSLGESISLVGYMVGAAAIFGLYLIIPLIILLNAFLPADWNKLIVALTVLMLGEFVILLILIKTTPRHKAKKGNMLVQP